MSKFVEQHLLGLFFIHLLNSLMRVSRDGICCQSIAPTMGRGGSNRMGGDQNYEVDNNPKTTFNSIRDNWQAKNADFGHYIYRRH